MLIIYSESYSHALIYSVYCSHLFIHGCMVPLSFSLDCAPFKLQKESTHRNLIRSSLFTVIGWHLMQEGQLTRFQSFGGITPLSWLLVVSLCLHVFAYTLSVSGVCFLHIFPANYYSFFKTWLEISFRKEVYPNSTREFIIAPFMSLLYLNITTITAPSYCIAIIFYFSFAFSNRLVCLRVRAIMYFISHIQV